ncbi:ribosome-associated protein [Caldanaerovirga acetigignens]|uniref:Ribosome-associated protein n=1 Tax=Caldanaerovirga acetigignens TaxID=447595 RepID=A0A1M7GQE9_9FIRM|nr:RNA-binding S4 domain-containing protein [Caldanaerovirga acetigignens]SHM18584.1 ribosome-associated protein [Caldanaerovirga acetigignens]
MKEVPIRTETINLDQFLKWSGIVLTGGQAKLIIKQGLVKVNGQVETKRSRKLHPGDVVEFQGQTFLVKGGSE